MSNNKNKSKNINNVTNFMKKCKYGNVGDIFKLSFKNINKVDYNGESAIFYAFYNPDHNVLEMLIKYNKTINNYVNLYLRNNEGYTIYDLIKRSNFHDKVKLLKLYNSVTDQFPDIINLDEYKFNILKTDNIEEFIKNNYLFSFDVILMACKLNSVKIINYCINDNFGLNFISQERLTPFFYLCKYNSIELINKYIDKINNKDFLLTKNKIGKTALEYLTYDNYEIKIKVLNMKNDTQYKINNFKIYKEEDFDFVDYSSANKSGAYGQAIHVIEKDTGKDMIIKKYRNSKYLLESSVITEIMLLKFINENNNHISPIIYGIYFDNDEICMVQEYLIYTLEDIIMLYNNVNDDIKHEEYKNIFRNLIENITIINSYGIVHNDLKYDNIMMDNNGRMKIIDFGISEYYGISPPNDYIKNSSITEFIKPPELNYKHKYYKDKYEKTLNTDIYSLGIIFMNIFLETNKKKYNYIDEEDKENEWYEDEEDEENEENESILFNIDPYLLDILKKMINVNSNKRSFGKELINHIYFTGIDYIEEEKNHNFLQIKTYNRREYNSLDKELKYFNEIVDVAKNLKFNNMTNDIPSKNITDRMVKITIDWIKDLNNLRINYNIDIICNTIVKIRYYFNNNKTIIKKEIQSFILMIYLFYSYLFNSYLFNYNDLLDYTDNSYKIKDFNIQVKNMLSDVENYNFIPIQTNISYIIKILQINNINIDFINKINKNIKVSIINWVTNSTCDQIEIQRLLVIIYTIHDVNNLYKFEDFNITNDEIKLVKNFI